MVTFAIYTIISVYWKGTTLEIAQAFSSLALISLLTSPVVLLTQILPNVIQCLGCFDRIQEYSNYSAELGKSDPLIIHDEGVSNGAFQPVSSQGDNVMMGKISKPNNPILLNCENIKWKPEGPIILKHINTTIEPGTFTALIGPVGSGKTTLLESILGETICESSTAMRYLPPASYCSQQPWLENKTIRDSITGAFPYDGKWYDTVVISCDLESDIERFADGNLTRIGSKGVSLSGGQKQRIVRIHTLKRY